MKRAILIVLAALCLSTATYGQAVTVTASAIKPNPSASAPSGACLRRNAVLIDADKIYLCPESGTQNWTEVSGGGGGTTINSTNGQLPYRVNSTTFGDSAFASNALNSTYLQATSGASGAGLTLAVAGGGTNENLKLVAKGTSGFLQLLRSSDSAEIARVSTSGFSVFDTLAVGSTNQLTFNASVGLTYNASAVARLTNASTGAGQLLIGQSTDTVSAQLDVRSQSTTRPAARFQAASTTSGTQEMFGVYDGSGNGTFVINAQGTFTSTAAATSTISGMFKANNFETISVAGYFGWNGRSAIESPADGSFRFGNYAGTSRFVLAADANDVMAQRNGTNAQILRIYNTYTSGSNYERLGIQASSNAFFVTPEAATGTVRELVVGAAGSVTRIRSSLATPSAPALADGDWWVECSGTSPARTCSILVRDTGATRTIATSVAF